MGAAFEVYKEIGHGLAEEIYQESLEIELEIRDINFKPKSELKTYYKGRELKKRYIPDLIVSEEIVTELKSVRELLPEHESQLLNYMRLTKKAVGYLVNFGPAGGVEWKRYMLQEFIPSH